MGAEGFGGEGGGAGGPAVEEVSPELPDSSKRVRILDRSVEASEGPKLEEAPVVVTGGRGMGGPGNFNILQEMAGLLGGAGGAPPAGVDAGWMPFAMQGGHTGKNVKPKFLFALGPFRAVAPQSRTKGGQK